MQKWLKNRDKIGQKQDRNKPNKPNKPKGSREHRNNLNNLSNLKVSRERQNKSTWNRATKGDENQIIGIIGRGRARAYETEI